MKLPDGSEFAWFLSGMWAAVFIFRAARLQSAGFFGVVAILIVAAIPALGLLFEEQLTATAQQLQRAFAAAR